MADWEPTRRGVLAGLGVGAGVGAGATGASAAAWQPQAGQIARANAGTIGVISGGVEGTYIRIAADLASVLDDGEKLRVLPVVGKGSVQNLSDIAWLRGIDVGIVQSDVLAYALRENSVPGIGVMVKYIAKLYDEEVHVLARPEITAVEQLAGKRVNVDVQGSGTAMTASLIFGALKLQVTQVNDTQANALQRLKDGDIAALVYVAGKPASLFTGLPQGSGLHFLPLPLSPELIETYLPSTLTAASYPALVSGDAAVETLAVGAVMAAYAWQPGTERHTKLMRFVAALTDRFAEFQKPPRHPKWREVNLSARVPGWSRLTAADPAPSAAAAPPRSWR
jgi:uncharacterized protein